MRLGILLPAIVSSFWIVPVVITAREFIQRTYLFSSGQPLFLQVIAILVPLTALTALIFCSYLYYHRKLHGIILVAVSALAFLGFTYHFVWLTGGV